MLRNIVISMCLFAIVMASGYVYSQEGAAPKKQGNKVSTEDDYTRDARIPQLYKRLGDAIQSLKLKTDEEGKYTFTISSGNQYDLIDRVFLVYKKKAMVYAAQGRISKIVFEYYQFNMTTQVREVKTFTTAAPDSEDLKALSVEYENNIGQKEKFTVGELQKPDSKRDVIKQYYAYYVAMVYKLELYKDKTIKIESSKIDRTIQLGD